MGRHVAEMEFPGKVHTRIGISSVKKKQREKDMYTIFEGNSDGEETELEWTESTDVRLKYKRSFRKSRKLSDKIIIHQQNAANNEVNNNHYKQPIERSLSARTHVDHMMSKSTDNLSMSSTLPRMSRSFSEADIAKEEDKHLDRVISILHAGFHQVQKVHDRKYLVKRKDGRASKLYIANLDKNSFSKSSIAVYDNNYENDNQYETLPVDISYDENAHGHLDCDDLW